MAAAGVYPSLQFPAEKRIPLGGLAFSVPVAESEKVVLTCPALKANAGEATFRITAAIDFREENALSLYLPETGAEVGIQLAM